MLNNLWVAMLVASMVCGAYNGCLDAVARATFEAAGAAVALSIGLVGVMSLWLGVMRILQEAGLLQSIARLLRPVMRRLFPTVPAGHPAMSLMILNFTANILGLGNAATPFGLKAMMELETLNDTPQTVSDPMILFLAINTSGLAVFPTSIMAIRAALGSQAPGAIFATTLLSTSFATLVAVACVKLLAVLPGFRIPSRAAAAPAAAPLSTAAKSSPALASQHLPPEAPPVHAEPPSRLRRWVAWALIAVSLGAFVYAFAQLARAPGGSAWGALKAALSGWALLLALLAFVLGGYLRGVKVYDAVVDGGAEGFVMAQKLIPFLVAILVAVGMLRASGAIDMMVAVIDPLTRRLGMPGEALPMALLRPLTGSGALAVAADIMKTHGPDSLVGEIVSTINGSTETTFYLIALYLGVTQVRNSRYLLIPCLLADISGTLAAAWTCRLLLH